MQCKICRRRKKMTPTANSISLFATERTALRSRHRSARLSNWLVVLQDSDHVSECRGEAWDAM
jgi:hypothetical protein